MATVHPKKTGMKQRGFLLLLFLCGFSVTLLAQGTPKTLLWRISGKGFTRPSYLYGTMHTGDKRVYYLGDSVYSGIRNCDGFAIELDPGEMIDSVLNIRENKELNVAYRDALTNDMVKKDEGYYRRMLREMDSLIIRIRQKYSDLTPRDIARLEKAYRRRYRNNMNTTFDLYLFDMAKRQSKIVGGIEDITDQTSLMDELGNSFDPDLFIKNQRKKYVDVTEWMVINYVNAELDQIHEFSKQSQTPRQVSLILNRRNDKMARRIDSLGSIRPTFCAVGAAHLPGDSGVINLLRKRGFTVEPVFSSRKIEPGDIRIENSIKELIVVSDPDSNYTVRMPGKPTSLTAISNKLFVKTYKELSNEIMLMCGVYEDGNISKTIDKEVDELKKFFSRYDIKLYEAAKISRQSLEGYDISFRNTQGYMRLHLFYRSGKVYMFAIGSKYKDSLQSARCLDYLSSYTMRFDNQRTQTEMISFDSPDKAFRVALPAMPKKETISGSITYTKEDVTLFSSVDTKRKINYLVLLKEPFKGFYNDFDSSIFKSTHDALLRDVAVQNSAEEPVLVDGHPALKTKVRGIVEDKTTVIHLVSFLRHNRFYTLTARALALPGNEEMFESFIGSFRFLPYLETGFTEQTGGVNLFSVMAPSPISVLAGKKKEAGRNDYYAYDSCTAMSYGITSLALGKLYWAENLSALLEDQSRVYFNEALAKGNLYGTDSLVYKKTVFNGNSEGRELLLKSMFNNTYSRVRILHNGDSVFIINSKGDQELVTNRHADQFFDGFRFIADKAGNQPFVSKTANLIAGLQSRNEAEQKPALELLKNGYRFPAADLPQMLNALLVDYGQTGQGADIPRLLGGSIVPHAGETVLAFIRQQYPLQKNKREELRLVMLEMLAASGQAPAYQFIGECLANDPPAGNSFQQVFEHFARFPGQTAALSSPLLSRLKDENLGTFIIATLALLIDSNQVTYNSVRQCEETVLSLAKKILHTYQENNNEKTQFPHMQAILDMLVRNPEKQSRNILGDLIKFRNYNLSLQVIKALAKNNQPIPVSLCDWFMAAPQQRVQLYDELARMGKQSLLQGESANQQSFADAFVRMYTDSDIGESITKYFDLVTIKNAAVKNKTSRFYIFKVTCQFRRGAEYYTAIIGPFSTNDAELSIPDGKDLFILYRVPFNPKETDNLFNDFIEKANKIE